MKRSVRRLNAMVTLGLFGWTIACTSVPLALPGPILAMDDVATRRAAVLQGMAVRGWIVEDEAAHRILARMHRRQHVAKVWVDYSEERITFRYGGSKGLDCTRDGDSCRSIHRNYNKWVRNLALDISRQVTQRRALE